MDLNLSKLKPYDLCRVLNSTPLGTVVSESHIRNHRARAGLWLGQDTIHLLRFGAWLIKQRHFAKPENNRPERSVNLTQVAEDAVSLVNQQSPGTSPLLKPQQEQALAGLLAGMSQKEVAAQVGVAAITICRWRKLPAFQEALARASTEAMKGSIHYLRIGTAKAAKTMIEIADHGARDSDKLRASDLVFKHARHTTHALEPLPQPAKPRAPQGPGDLVTSLADDIQNIDASDLPLETKARLKTMLAKPFLQAHEISISDDRAEAIQTILVNRRSNRGKQP